MPKNNNLDECIKSLCALFVLNPTERQLTTRWAKFVLCEEFSGSTTGDALVKACREGYLERVPESRKTAYRPTAAGLEHGRAYLQECEHFGHFAKGKEE